MLVARKTGLAGARPVPERLERLVEAEQPGGAAALTPPRASRSSAACKEPGRTAVSAAYLDPLLQGRVAQIAQGP